MGKKNTPQYFSCMDINWKQLILNGLLQLPIIRWEIYWYTTSFDLTFNTINAEINQICWHDRKQQYPPCILFESSAFCDSWDTRVMSLPSFTMYRFNMFKRTIPFLLSLVLSISSKFTFPLFPWCHSAK